ncbi:MAG: hypothetical protein LC785_16220 [Acidobacteria bacterium]|nr:hypothetical protein [Acidobacteriota bacterium]
MAIRTKEPKIIAPVIMAATVDVIYRKQQRLTFPEWLNPTIRTTIRDPFVNHRPAESNRLLVMREGIAQHKYLRSRRFL